MKLCSVDGCLYRVVAKDLCYLHYQRKRRTGKITSRREKEIHSEDLRPVRLNSFEQNSIFSLFKALPETKKEAA